MDIAIVVQNGLSALRTDEIVQQRGVADYKWPVEKVPVACERIWKHIHHEPAYSISNSPSGALTSIIGSLKLTGANTECPVTIKQLPQENDVHN